MKGNIELSVRSRKLMEKYWVACDPQCHNFPLTPLFLDLETLLYWLNKEYIVAPEHLKKDQQQAAFLLVFLRAELLHDLFFSMSNDDPKIGNKDKNASKIEGVKFALFTAAGLLVAACEGFDGIITMLNVFSLPPLVILGAGFVFSFLSIVAFRSIELIKISKALGINLHHAYKLLNTYLIQLQNIKAIRREIDEYVLAELSLNELKQLEQIVFMLQKNFLSLIKASKQFEQALHGGSIQIFKTIISGVSALFFFAGGFCAGQSVAFFISGFLISSVTPFFWPIMIFSFIVGLASLGIYWYVESPGLNKLVSNWFGLNEQSIEQLGDNNLIVEEEKKLANLNEKITSTIKLENKINQLEEDVTIYRRIIPSKKDDAVIDREASANVYSFLKPLKLPHPHPDQEETAVCFPILEHL